MEQSAEQSARRPARHAGGNPAWVKGISSPYPDGRESAQARREQHLKLMTDVAADMGGVDALSPGDAILLAEACWLLMSKPRKHVDRVRAINTANRIIEALRERHAPKRQPTDPYLTLLDPGEERQNKHAGTPKPEAEKPALDPRLERAKAGDRIKVHDGLMGEDRVIEVTEDDDGDAPQ
jgi:hypothetical protein